MAMDHKRPVDMRQVIARIIDDSDFTEFGAEYGPATVCGHARIEGQAIGIITNNGPLDPGRRQQGHAFHSGLLPVAHAAALSQQHHRLHGRQAPMRKPA